MLPRTWWYYRRRPAWMDNYSETQLRSGGCLTILLLPLIVVGSILLLYGLLAYVLFEPTFWAIAFGICIWGLFQSK